MRVQILVRDGLIVKLIMGSDRVDQKSVHVARTGTSRRQGERLTTADSTDPIDVPPDHALWSILASNLLTLAVALLFHWDVRDLLWPYWLQSVIIGAFAARRMAVLRRFDAEGFSINDQPATESTEALHSTVLFFIVHYNFFHFGYLVFLWTGWMESGSAVTWLDRLGIIVLALSFVWSHWHSHREHVAADLAGRPNLGKLMLMPYLRVIPMHLVILFGAARGGGAVAVMCFVALKTLADLGMHRFEHRRLQQRARPVAARARERE